MKIRALCIGVSEYATLAPTASSARAVAKQLTLVGADVLLLENPGISELDNAVRLLCDPFEALDGHNKEPIVNQFLRPKLPPAPADAAVCGLLFFSGLWFASTAKRNESFLAPGDLSIGQYCFKQMDAGRVAGLVRSRCVSLGDITQRMSQAGLTPVVLVDSSGQHEIPSDWKRFLQDGGFQQASAVAKADCAPGSLVVAGAPDRGSQQQLATSLARGSTAFTDGVLGYLGQPGARLGDLAGAIADAVASGNSPAAKGAPRPAGAALSVVNLLSPEAAACALVPAEAATSATTVKWRGGSAKSPRSTAAAAAVEPMPPPSVAQQSTPAAAASAPQPTDLAGHLAALCDIPAAEAAAVAAAMGDQWGVYDWRGLEELLESAALSADSMDTLGESAGLKPLALVRLKRALEEEQQRLLLAPREGGADAGGAGGNGGAEAAPPETRQNSEPAAVAAAAARGLGPDQPQQYAQPGGADALFSAAPAEAPSAAAQQWSRPEQQGQSPAAVPSAPPPSPPPAAGGRAARDAAAATFRPPPAPASSAPETPSSTSAPAAARPAAPGTTRSAAPEASSYWLDTWAFPMGSDIISGAGAAWDGGDDAAAGEGSLPGHQKRLAERLAGAPGARMAMAGDTAWRPADAAAAAAGLAARASDGPGETVDSGASGCLIGLEAVLERLRSVPLWKDAEADAGELEDAALFFLARLCSSPTAGGQVSRKVVASGGVAAVANVMRARTRSAAVQEQGCWALRAIAARGGAEGKRAVFVELPEVVVAGAMGGQHADCLPVVQAALAATAQTFERLIGENLTEEDRESMVARVKGVLPSVAAAMRGATAGVHRRRQQEAAARGAATRSDRLFLVAGESHPHPRAGDAAAAAAAAEREAFEAQATLVQICGCAVVRNVVLVLFHCFGGSVGIAMNKAAQDRAIQKTREAGALAGAAACADAVVEAMRLHFTDPGVQLQGCVVLRTLALLPTEDFRQVAPQAVRAAAEGLAAFPEESAIAEMAGAALRVILCRAYNALPGHEAVSAATWAAARGIVVAMVSNISAPWVQQQGCAALSWAALVIVQGGWQGERPARRGAGDAAGGGAGASASADASSRRRHRAPPGGGEVALSLFTAAGGMGNAVVGALRAHSNDTAVVSAALRCLAHISLADTHLEKPPKRGGGGGGGGAAGSAASPATPRTPQSGIRGPPMMTPRGGGGGGGDGFEFSLARQQQQPGTPGGGGWGYSDDPTGTGGGVGDFTPRSQQLDASINANVSTETLEDVLTGYRAAIQAAAAALRAHPYDEMLQLAGLAALGNIGCSDLCRRAVREAGAAELAEQAAALYSGSADVIERAKLLRANTHKTRLARAFTRMMAL